MSVSVGDRVPEFELVDQNREPLSSASLRGKKGIIVFIPFPFTGVCTSEACEIPENIEGLNGLDANVVMITTHALPTTRRWAKEHGVDYPVLSDFWPHGQVAKEFGTFDDSIGVATRSTYVYDEDGIIRDIVASDSYGLARPYAEYLAALESL